MGSKSKGPKGPVDVTVRQSPKPETGPPLPVEDAAGSIPAVLIDPSRAAIIGLEVLKNVHSGAPVAPVAFDRKAIEARAAAATKGPWEAKRNPDKFDDDGKLLDSSTTHLWYITGPSAPGDKAPSHICGMGGFSDQHQANAVFAAAARSDVPALLAEVSALEGQLKGLIQAIEDLFVVATTDTDAEGIITAYHFKTGALHRLLGQARGLPLAAGVIRAEVKIAGGGHE